jgi:hypothetical protein
MIKDLGECFIFLAIVVGMPGFLILSLAAAPNAVFSFRESINVWGKRLLLIGALLGCVGMLLLKW